MYLIKIKIKLNSVILPLFRSINETVNSAGDQDEQACQDQIWLAMIPKDTYNSRTNASCWEGTDRWSYHVYENH